MASTQILPVPELYPMGGDLGGQTQLLQCQAHGLDPQQFQWRECPLVFLNPCFYTVLKQKRWFIVIEVSQSGFDDS
jgi:hypothetical protein